LGVTVLLFISDALFWRLKGGASDMSIWTLVWLDFWAGGKLGNVHSGETSFDPLNGRRVF
jgi:hypothetical protein